jgi:hypothetical protein
MSATLDELMVGKAAAETALSVAVQANVVSAAAVGGATEAEVGFLLSR